VQFASAAMPSFMRDSWQASVSEWIVPLNAVSQVQSTAIDPSGHMLSPWVGFAVFAGHGIIPCLRAGGVPATRHPTHATPAPDLWCARTFPRLGPRCLAGEGSQDMIRLSGIFRHFYTIA
jgi:hypothetical protein